MNTRIVIDFDGVLFDISSFKKDYFALFEKLGVPSVLVETTYKRSKEGGYYNADLHLEALESKTDQVGELKKAILHFLEDTSKYVFADAIPFLSSLRKRGCRTYILSTGTQWFQKEKIDHSGVSEYVEEICITDEPLKINSFGRIYQLCSSPVFFIDDTLRVVEALKKNFPDITALHLRRFSSAAKAASICDEVVENLDRAAEKIILSGY